MAGENAELYPMVSIGDQPERLELLDQHKRIRGCRPSKPKKPGNPEKPEKANYGVAPEAPKKLSGDSDFFH